MSQQVYDKKEYIPVGVGEVININNHDKNASSHLKTGEARYNFTYKLPTTTNQHGFTHATISNYYLAENFFNIREGMNVFTLAFEEVTGSNLFVDYKVTVPPGYYSSYVGVFNYIKDNLQQMLDVAHSHVTVSGGTFAYEHYPGSGTYLNADKFYLFLFNNGGSSHNHKWYIKGSTGGPNYEKKLPNDVEYMLGMQDINAATQTVFNTDTSLGAYLSPYSPTENTIPTAKVYSNLHKSRTGNLLFTARIRYLGSLAGANTTNVGASGELRGPLPLQLRSSNLSTVQFRLTDQNDIPLQGTVDFGIDFHFFEMRKTNAFDTRTRIY